MKLSISIIVLFVFQLSFSQTILGKWKTIDDETGKEMGVVQIFENKGKVFGKIIEIVDQDKRHLKCVKCSGEDHNKPILGMTILKGLTKNGSVYNGGEIIDPKNGKSYKCKITLKGKDKLIVRGYIGISLFGRSQNWIREN